MLNEQLAVKIIKYSLRTNKTVGLPLYGICLVDTARKITKLDDLILGLLSGQKIITHRMSRWVAEPAEEIILDKIFTSPEVVYLPVAISWPSQRLNVHVYSNIGRLDDDHLRVYAKNLEDEFSMPIRLVGENVFLSGANKIINTFLKRLPVTGAPKTYEDIKKYSDLDVKMKETFQALVADKSLSGFPFLYDNIRKRGSGLGVLCAMCDERIVGAFGPLDVQNDIFNASSLASAYFGVLSEYRGRGYAKKLWETALAWASQEDATYCLVQSPKDSPAAKFYEKSGLEVAGFRTTL